MRSASITSEMLHALAVCSVMVMTSYSVMACTPTQELSLNEKITGADVVLLGEVLRLYKEPRIPGNAYTAEMKIYCVLKAPRNIPVTAVHNISEAGVIDGRCYSVNLEVSKQYIILGYTVGQEIRPYDDGIEATAENIQQVSLVCGMSPRLPIGIAPSDSMRCPLHVDEKGCIINTPVNNNVNSPDSPTDPGYVHHGDTDTEYNGHQYGDHKDPDYMDPDHTDDDTETKSKDEGDEDASNDDASEYEMAAVHNMGSVVSQTSFKVLSTAVACFIVKFCL